MSALWGREGVCDNEEKRTGEGRCLAICGHPFQCDLCKKEKGTCKSFYHHLPVLKIEK